MTRAALAIGSLAVLLSGEGVCGSQAPASEAATIPPSPAHVAAGESVDVLRLIKTSDTTAVIRAGSGPIHTVKVDDVVGVTKAVVKEIGAGRLVLEETLTDKDGKPNRALIVFQEGERGGTRYLQRPGEPAFTGTRPLIVMPAAPDPAKPAPKKPPQM